MLYGDDGPGELACDRHEGPFACPDALIPFTARFREYPLIVHDG
ncbi:DUF6980 family protein [Streptomyces glomeratus]